MIGLDHLQHKPKRIPARALVLACLLTVTPAVAVTPLSPRLDPPSRADLKRQLDAVEFPDSHVERSLEAVLGLTPETREYEYRMEYAPQAPRVDAKATPTEGGCVEVELTAWYERPPQGGATRIRLDGMYCMQAPGRWQAKSQLVEAVSVDD